MKARCYDAAMGTALEQTLIVMPAYNESHSVARVVTETRETLPGVTVLVVDDGSSDATSTLAREAGAVVVTVPFNLGVGGAMRVGFRYALEHSYQAVVQIDADGQHDPRTVQALLDGLDTHDIVIAARFAGEGSYVMRGPRRWASWVLARQAFGRPGPERSRCLHATTPRSTSATRSNLSSSPAALDSRRRKCPLLCVDGQEGCLPRGP
jgi:glycosyltransferase involved in cell wall biosynthesis